MKTSVAFSGSGFKVPAHVGALAAIEFYNHDIEELAGTSGGSIVAALKACGMRSSEIYDIVLGIDWDTLLEFNFWSMFSGSYCNGKEIYRLVREYTEGKTFSQIDIPLKIVASDLKENKPFIFSQETTPDVEIALAVRASTSIPIVYEPVKFDGKVLVDGGIVNNIPVDRLDLPGTKKIGIQLQATEVPEGGYNLRWPWNILARVISLMMDLSENTHVSSAVKKGAEMVFIETGYVNGLDTGMPLDMKTQLFEDGLTETTRLLASMS